jgi:hypothetical protein
MPRRLRRALAGSPGGASSEGADATLDGASTTSLEIEMSHDRTFTKGHAASIVWRPGWGEWLPALQVGSPPPSPT